MAYALPELIETIFQKHITWFIRILPIALTIIFWNGLIIYALSDIPAVVIVTLGLLVLSRISDHNKFQINLMMSCLCGFFCGLAYYIRSGCKPIILIAVFIIFIYKFKKAISKKIISVIIMCLGMGLSMIPQVLINISCNHTISYEVPIFFTTKFAEGEYYLGFKLLRYETNITGLHPDLALGSYDSVIDNILKAEDISSNEVDLETIVGLGIKYPLEFLGMYATKFANYLDPRYGNSLYITNLNSRQYGIMIFNYLLWFLAFFGIGTELSSPEDGERTQWENLLYFIKNYFLYIFAFILPALIHLLGTQVEVRYFYPCYILMYTYLAMLCPWKQMYKFFRKRWVTTLIICFAFFGCLNAIWNFTFENFSYADLLLKDSQNISIENIESDG